MLLEARLQFGAPAFAILLASFTLRVIVRRLATADRRPAISSLLLYARNFIYALTREHKNIICK
jgi:hypothetical protein